MWWMPLALLGWKALRALIEWDQKEAAKYRCSYCRTDDHSTKEHLRPKFTPARKAELVKCQIAVPFVLAAFVVGILFLNHDLDHWVGGAVVGVIGWPLWAAAVRHRFRKYQLSARKMDGKKEGHMNATPELTDKQNEALDTLVDLFRRSRKNDPEAQTAFLGVALLLAQQSMLDYLVAALLTQAQNLNIRPTKSLLFKDMAFEIEAIRREKK